jgi:hypothetical protein
MPEIAPMPYEARESINPRIFALRHALLEELKRRQGLLQDDVGREAFVALARALDVSYDATTRHYVVHGSGAKAEVPLDAFRCYAPRIDASAAQWQREDEILEANRTLASSVIDQLAAKASGRKAP